MEAVRVARLYSCITAPSLVRAGDPVVLSVKPNKPGDSVIWHSSGGVVDAGVGQSVVDTSNLHPGSFLIRAEITHSGQPVGRCATGFTIDPKATVAAWPSLNIVGISLRKGEREYGGFAVYTYVLYRRKPVSPEEVTRFKNILGVIAAYPSPAEYEMQSYQLKDNGLSVEAQEEADMPLKPLREFAPIIVPVDESIFTPVDASWLLEHYDPSWASQLLRNLKCQRTTDRTNCRHKLSGDGPFLISTEVRLTGEPDGFLVQDLGSTSPEAGGEWVTRYMAMVTQKRNWVYGYTLQQASLDFAKDLDVAGGELQKSASAVKSAIAFFKIGRK
jgi:hypothetical protein